MTYVRGRTTWRQRLALRIILTLFNTFFGTHHSLRKLDTRDNQIVADFDDAAVAVHSGWVLDPLVRTGLVGLYLN